MQSQKSKKTQMVDQTVNTTTIVLKIIRHNSKIPDINENKISAKKRFLKKKRGPSSTTLVASLDKSWAESSPPNLSPMGSSRLGQFKIDVFLLNNHFLKDLESSN